MSYTVTITEPNRTITAHFENEQTAIAYFNLAFTRYPKATEVNLYDDFDFVVYTNYNEATVRYYVVKCAGVEKHFYHINAALTHLKALNDFFADSEIVATLEAVN